MLEVGQCMNHTTMGEMLEKAHSRIPVYEGERTNVRGILLVKCLIALDPDDATPITTLMEDSRCFRPITFAAETMPLYDLLNEFQKGKSKYGYLFFSVSL